MDLTSSILLLLLFVGLIAYNHIYYSQYILIFLPIGNIIMVSNLL